MKKLFFWKNWVKSERILYIIGLLVFAGALLFFLVSYFQGTAATIDWVVVSQSSAVKVIVDVVELGPVSLKSYADNYLITEYFEGGALRVNQVSAYIFISFIVISMAFYQGIITTLKRYWYIFGTAIFVFMLISFQLDQLMLFGGYQNFALYILLGVYLPLSYYFHAFSEVSLWKRVLIFLLTTLVLGVGIIQFSSVENPLYYMVNYGMYFTLIVTILFIFMVSFEVIAGLLYIITNSNTSASKNSLTHFIVATIIYLGYVALTYMKNSKSIDWDIYYLNPFLLLCVSIILGIWGFRNRRALYQNVIGFSTQGGLVYLTLGTISFATIGYFFATANDPFVEVIEDAIVFGHLSFGLFFFFYVVINFGGLMKQNLQVYKVLYKPQIMPLLAVTFVSLIGVAAFFFNSDKIALSQAVSGYNNGLGDVYLAENNYFLAAQYYTFGMQYAHYNHRSNYSLAALSLDKGEELDAMQYFDQALLKKPTPYAYANLANLYTQKGMFFDALFLLKEGLKKFPESGELMSNLGMLYSKTSIIDSAMIYLNLPRTKTLSGEVAATNILALLINKDLRLNSDSLAEAYADNTYLPAQTNLITLFNRDHKSINYESSSLGVDSTLNLVTFSHFYNLIFNKNFSHDSSLISNVDSYLKSPKNLNYTRDLNLAKAMNLYQSGAVSEAFKLMDRLQVESSQKAGYYNNVRGIWAMGQESPRLALDFFDKADAFGSSEGSVNKVFALLAIDSLSAAKGQIAKLSMANDGLISELQMVQRVLEIDSQETLMQLTDQEKYLYLKTYLKRLDNESAEALAASITHPYFTPLARYELLKDNLSSDDERINGLSDVWKEKIFLSEMDGYVSSGAIENLKGRMSNSVIRDKKNATKSLFYKAVLSQSKGKVKEATSQFKKIANKNAFDEVMTIKSAMFFQNVMKDEMVAYNILLNALTINPYSAKLKEQYILQCLNMGMTDYAAAELEVLKGLLSSDEFNDYKIQYDKKLDEMERASENWEE